MGLVELRDYEVNRYILENKPIKVIVGDEYMILTPSMLKRGRVNNTQHSFINKGQMYKLIGWEWKGTRYKDQDVDISIDVRKRLGEEFRKIYAKGN